MNKHVSALLGSVAAMATVSVAYAAAPAPEATGPAAANSYAELLDPIPNASTLLRAQDAAITARPTAQLQLAQFHHHHHHHHHHHGFGFSFGIGPGPYAAPDCTVSIRRHWNGYRWVRERVRTCY